MMNRKIFKNDIIDLRLLFSIVLLGFFSLPVDLDAAVTNFVQNSKNRVNCFTPGMIWNDSNGNAINAHGGGVLFYKKTYYWFGEYKVAGKIGNSAQVGISCYSSKDLIHWKDEGIVFKVDENGSNSDIEKGCIIERPKVVFNKKTGKFVMWFHLELKGKGYGAALASVAVSDEVIGPYKYLRSYRPDAGQWPINFKDEWKQKSDGEDTLKWWTNSWTNAVINGLFVRNDFQKGQMSRDMTIFEDDNEKAYLVSSSEENLTLHISELSDDYLSFTGKWKRILPAGHNEAPA
ncbi:MAG: glycoside hydrolase family 43 protein, partial [Bacteroidota bacterium]|nr:glycoside hydrolase family 43 protein [Bacteroidota bacterium]